jgi:hypothetical protein
MNTQISKSAYLFGTIGLAAGVFYSFRKGDDIKKVAVSGLVIGVCGFIVGSAINKLYE